MRKATILIMAVALVLGLAQCKKNTDIVPVQSGTATITLKVSGGDKLSVNPNTGTVGFTKGDVIYAVGQGTYRGKLTHNGSDFTGNITIDGLTTSDYLYFYFLGNKTPSELLTSGSTGTFTVSIWDQTENYPVISVGKSDQTYNVEKKFTSTLLNQCALVKFNVTTSSEYAPTIITGVNDKLVIALTDGGIGTFTTSQERGAVKMAGGSGERWAILLPQSATGVGAAYSADLSYRGTHGELPTITENGYLTNGINVNVSTSNEFTVGGGKKVRFSQGNLQYQASTNTWRFAENQYTIIGNELGNTCDTLEATRSKQDKWIDLFGWGTSGWNNGNKCYQPWNATNKTTGSYASTKGYGYGPTNGSSYELSLTEEYKNADWGVYNGSAITNNYGTTSWRVMDNTENSTLYGSTSRRVQATVVDNNNNEVKGLIVLPDDFTLPSGIGMTMGVTSFTTNRYELNQWTLLEAAGAVFLPAAGYRSGASVNSVGSSGYYWSSTANGTDKAYYLNFGGSGVNPSGNYFRYIGRSVRLVSVL